MAKLVATCPSCRGELEVTRLHCPSCEMQLEGRFEMPALLRLSPDDLAFVTSFVRESGSLKAMAKLTDASYPTVRNRLDEIIAKLAPAAATATRDGDKRHAILDALERGTMTADEALAALKKVSK